MTSTKVHFAQPAHSEFNSWDSDLIPKMEDEFSSGPCREKYILSRDPETADIIIFLESCVYKFRSHVNNLAQEPLIQRYAEKLFTYNYTDDTFGFLDGAYVYLKKSRSNPAHYRARPDLIPPNERTYQVSEKDIFSRKPKLLASFRGSLSHKLRSQIVSHFEEHPSPDIRMTVIDRWYNHNESEKDTYLDELLDSKFVLCPRGISHGTPRIIETLAMGRVPVILADHWTPYDGLELGSTAIRIKESDYQNIESTLRKFEKDADEMGQNGRRFWEANFSKSKRLVSLIDCLVSLQRTRQKPMTYQDYVERWHSLAFSWKNEWTLPQRAIRKLGHALGY